MTNTRIVAAIACATLIGSGTFVFDSLRMVSANPILAAIQIASMVLIIPGLSAATDISGNAADFSLGAAALVNALFYFGVSWVLFPLALRFKRTEAESRG